MGGPPISFGNSLAYQTVGRCSVLISGVAEKGRQPGKLPSFETRYFISSLHPDEIKPCDFQKVIRDYWQVETSLHFVKDRWWEEDRHYLESPGLGQVWIALTNAALSVLRLVQVPGEPLTQTAENFHYSPRKALQILGFSIF